MKKELKLRKPTTKEREYFISLEEEAELIQRIKRGDQIAQKKLIKGNMRFVVSVAKQYQHKGLTLVGLVNAGKLGLIKAAEEYDEMSGLSFVGYAVWWIRQSILQALEQPRISVEAPTVEELLYMHGNNYSPNADRSLITESLSREIDSALDTLESDVVKLFFGIGCKEMTLEAIGKLLGLTRERARRIKEKALRRLNLTSYDNLLKLYMG